MIDLETGISPAPTCVLVRVREADKVTAGGIIIPDVTHSRDQLSAESGVVVAIGDGVLLDVGKEVTFTRYAGKTPCGKNGKALDNYRVVKDTDVWCSCTMLIQSPIVDGQPELRPFDYVTINDDGMLNGASAFDATHIYYGVLNGRPVLEVL